MDISKVEGAEVHVKWIGDGKYLVLHKGVVFAGEDSPELDQLEVTGFDELIDTLREAFGAYDA